MAAWQDAEDAIRTSVKLVMTSPEIYISYQNGPEPETPYCALEVTQLDPVGREEVSSGAELNGSVYEVTIKENYLATAKFSFAGKDTTDNHAGDLALEFSQLLTSPAMQIALRKNGLSYQKKGIIRRIPKVRETRWYNTYAIDVVFGFYLERTQQVDIIDNVGMTGTYESVTTIVDNINIP